MGDIVQEREKGIDKPSGNRYNLRVDVLPRWRKDVPLNFGGTSRKDLYKKRHPYGLALLHLKMMLFILQAGPLFAHEPRISLSGIVSFIIDVYRGAKGSPAGAAGIATVGIDVDRLSHEARQGLAEVVTTSIEIVDSSRQSRSALSNQPSALIEQKIAST